MVDNRENFEGQLCQQTVIGYGDEEVFLIDEEGSFYSLYCDPEVAPLGISLPAGIAQAVTDVKKQELCERMIEVGKRA